MKSKLKLKKEALAELDNDAMRAVAGGWEVSLLLACQGGTFSCNADCCSYQCTGIGICCPPTDTCLERTAYGPAGY